ncbi:MAG: radical SAM protein [Myxococcales bacterium]|nr:radical SAM protein [Myxococcales bacterium]
MGGKTPRRLILQVTPRCNARCAHCAYGGGPRRHGLMEVGAAAAFLDAFCRLWGAPRYAALTGGEPMLFPERTLTLARLLSARGAAVRLLTNGSWATGMRAARARVEDLRSSGVSGLWVSASAFHQEHVPLARLEMLLEAAAVAGMPCYLAFTFIHPRELGLRGKGEPAVDERVPQDLRSLALLRRLTGRFPFASLGWARLWDLGRARGVFRRLGSALATEVRADLARAAASGEGDLLDLVGLSVNGEVFFRERTLGRARGLNFAAPLAALPVSR